MIERRTRSVLLVALAGPCLAFGCARPPAANGKQPARSNVLLVVIDALRADGLHCYGNPRPTSPNIDALAARSLLYERVLASAPWTVPAVASLLTSTPPSLHGHIRAEDRLSDELLTLPEALKEEGYATAAFSYHPWVSPELGFDQGFEATDFHVLRRGGGVKHDTEVTDAALRWIEAAAAARPVRPFFAYLHYMGPHSPYAPPREAMMSVLGHIPVPPALSARLAGLSRPRFYPALMKATQRGEVTSADAAYLRALYDAEILVVDREIGRLQAGLRATGVDISTLVVVTSDHGEAFLEHGKMLHTDSVYQEMLHVPLIVALPEQRAGRRLAHWVQQVDIAPTVLDALRLPRPPQMQGISRLPGRDPGKGPVFAEASADRRFKIIRDGFSYLARAGADDKGKLYDLSADPGETSNIRAARPELARDLARELEEYRRLNLQKGQHLRRAAAATLDPRRREELRALGYAN